MFHPSVQQTRLFTPFDGFWHSLPPELEQSNRNRPISPTTSLLCASTCTQTTHFATSSSPTYTLWRPGNPEQSNAYHKEMTSESQKYRCWDHNCSGRTFSTLGNYRRHIRERSGKAKTFLCQDCRRLFTRSTALNSHRRRCPALKLIPDVLSCTTSPSHA